MTEELDPRLVELAHQMFDLARSGSEQLGTYVDRGVPVDMADPSGNTLLMIAAYNGRVGTVTALLDRGADVNRLNDRGQSMLAGAIFKGEDAVVRTLMDAGADLDAGNPSARATAEMFERGHLLDRDG